MKKELRLKDLLTVDPTGGSYVYDPLDIMITAYKKRKRDWMISETDPECECEEEDCECDCECHNIEESVYDTMSKYELGAELRRINKEIETLKKQDADKATANKISILTNARDSVLSMLKEDVVAEELTLQQRLKRRQIMKRLKSRIKIGRIKASRRRASFAVLKARANRAARALIAKRLLGGKNKSEVSFAARSRVEKALASRKNLIQAMASKLLPQIRARETKRFSQK